MLVPILALARFVHRAKVLFDTNVTLSPARPLYLPRRKTKRTRRQASMMERLHRGRAWRSPGPRSAIMMTISRRIKGETKRKRRSWTRKMRKISPSRPRRKPRPRIQAAPQRSFSDSHFRLVSYMTSGATGSGNNSRPRGMGTMYQASWEREER